MQRTRSHPLLSCSSLILCHYQAGTYCSKRCTSAARCPIGAYCEARSARPTLCPDGTFSPLEGMRAESACQSCPPGSRCPQGASKPMRKLPGSFYEHGIHPQGGECMVSAESMRSVYDRVLLQDAALAGTSHGRGKAPATCVHPARCAHPRAACNAARARLGRLAS